MYDKLIAHGETITILKGSSHTYNGFIHTHHSIGLSFAMGTKEGAPRIFARVWRIPETRHLSGNKEPLHFFFLRHIRHLLFTKFDSNHSADFVFRQKRTDREFGSVGHRHRGRSQHNLNCPCTGSGPLTTLTHPDNMWLCYLFG